MTVFQWIMLPVLMVVGLIELVRFARDRRRLRLLRTVVWIVAAVLIADPDSATSLAQLVGIGRGTDFVFYVFMLVTPAVMFHLYSQQFRMRQDIVLLARREALGNPQPGYGLPHISVELDGQGDSFEASMPSGRSPGKAG
ncbi:MAG: DUF2304 family protein [Planctomycetota bacterium]|jgi:hypothetical protein